MKKFIEATDKINKLTAERDNLERGFDTGILMRKVEFIAGIMVPFLFLIK